MYTCNNKRSGERTSFFPAEVFSRKKLKRLTAGRSRVAASFFYCGVIEKEVMIYEITHLFFSIDDFQVGKKKITIFRETQMKTKSKNMFPFFLSILIATGLLTSTTLADTPYFQNVAPSTGVANTGSGNGAVWIDYDNDGDLDLYFVNDPGSGGFYRNNLRETGNANFTSVSVGVSGSGNKLRTRDYNDDGWMDVLLERSGNAILYRNNGDGTFSDITSPSGISVSNSNRAAWGDYYDQDGKSDLYFGEAAQLYKNNGDGTFTDKTSEAFPATPPSATPAWIDYDNDEYDDLFLAPGSGSLILYHNEGDGSFVDVSAPSDVNLPSGGAQIAVGDYDGNGYQDIYVFRGGSDNYLFHNNGNGTFSEVALAAGVQTTAGSGNNGGVAFLDFDLDGDLDLFANGGRYGSNNFFENNGDGTFTDIIALTGLANTDDAHGIAVGDFDADGYPDIYEVCFTGSGSSANKLFINKPRWILLDGELNILRHGLTGEALNGYLYAICGVVMPGSPSDAQNAVSKYNPATDSWILESSSSMPTARHSLSSAVIGDYIYAVGGHVGNSRSENERFDGTSWETRASVYARSSPGVAAGCDGKLYAFGGNHSGTILSRFDIYDPTTDTWSYGGEMPAATQPGRAVTLNCKIYLTAGGSVDPKKVWCYDPVADTWDTSIPLMNVSRAQCELQAVNGRIYAIGGSGGSGAISSVESWALGDTTWRMEPSLNIARNQFASAVIGNDIYVFGGYNDSELGSTELLRTRLCTGPIEGDVNNDCRVDLKDVAIIGSHWLECNFVQQRDCW